MGERPVLLAADYPCRSHGACASEGGSYTENQYGVLELEIFPESPDRTPVYLWPFLLSRREYPGGDRIVEVRVFSE